MLGNDHWTLELESLGMAEAGDELARLLLTCRPPYAVCVQGKWGSGKTSLMRYAMARLGGEPLQTILETQTEAAGELPVDLDKLWHGLVGDSRNFIEATVRPRLAEPPLKLRDQLLVVPIWFNPWQHQTAELPVVALLQELRQQFTHLVKFGRKVKNLSQVAVEAALPLLGEVADSFIALKSGLKPGFGQVLGSVRGVAEAHERRSFEAVHDAQRINLLFHEAVDRLLRRQGPGFAKGLEGEPMALRRLVVFVDDLDRCAESQTVHLLEAIKLYLQTPNCVFVFGMDSTAARRAVSKVLSQGNETAREYLEKLFQSTVRVPLPRSSEGFVEKLLGYVGLGANETGLEMATLARRIVGLVEPNPRKLKNFVNNLAAGWRVRRSCGGEVTGFGLYLLLNYLWTYHPDVFRLLSYDPLQAEALHRVLTEPELLLNWPAASPVDHFLHSSFRHALSKTFGLSEGPRREEADQVVEELIDRLDRHRSDQAFMRLWSKELDGRRAEEVPGLLLPVLHVVKAGGGE